MNIVLLSEGSETRFLSVSIGIFLKPFLSLFSNKKSMLEKTYYNIKKFFSNVLIATQEEYKEIINLQIKDKINYIIEPQKIRPFGAILNAAICLKYEKKLSDDDFVSIIPTDHDVDESFYKILFNAKNLLVSKKLNVCLIGVKPTFPSIQFGYILHKKDIVDKFFEKSDKKSAKKLINENALWNSGIVIFKLRHIVDLSQNYFKYKSYNDFLKKYGQLPNNSFDEEFLEKEKNCVIGANTNLNDLGNLEITSKKISKPDEFNTNIINFGEKS